MRRKVEIDGKIIQLSPKEIKNLLNRFNPENFIYEDGKKINYTECIFCNKYICFECPWQKFGRYRFGCFYAIQKVLGENFVFSVGQSFIAYSVEREKLTKKAEKQLSLLYNTIKKKIGKEVKKDD